jgi:hypothetical protein
VKRRNGKDWLFVPYFNLKSFPVGKVLNLSALADPVI